MVGENLGSGRLAPESETGVNNYSGKFRVENGVKSNLQIGFAFKALSHFLIISWLTLCTHRNIRRTNFTYTSEHDIVIDNKPRKTSQVIHQTGQDEARTVWIQDAAASGH
jgi:hypothetical protein